MEPTKPEACQKVDLQVISENKTGAKIIEN
jgi:hypothetical protein